MQPAIHVSLYL